MKRKPCLKNEKEQIPMTAANLKICLSNQEGTFETLKLNESLHLQYYGFCNIDNLEPFCKLNTLFLNNNVIKDIQNLSTLTQLRTLNLSYNRIQTIKNLNQLHQLYTLDLSNNLIESVPGPQLQGLKNLNHLKLNHNKLKSYQSVAGLITVEASLTYLDLSSNQTLDYDPLIYTEVLGKLKVTVLGLSNTAFSRNVPSYRKETINAVKSLTYLDERPVSPEERMLAEAWKTGGLVLEKQVRAQIRQKTVQKHNKIYSEMEERNKVVEEKRKRVFDKLTNKESVHLNELMKERKSQDYQLLSEQEQSLLNLKIQDLQKYLQLMVEAVKSMDLDKQLNQGKVQLPRMIIDRETPEAIYVYNVSQEQIPLIIEKYYPDETRPVVAINHQNPAQTRWIKEYDQLLHGLYEQTKGNVQMLVPLFNLEIYELDSTFGRKAKRFEQEELKYRLKAMSEEQAKRQRSIEALYQLD